MDERALAFRIDERAPKSARSRKLARVCFVMQGRMVFMTCGMCSRVLCMEERALWEGRARGCVLHDDGLRGYKDVSPCRVGWVALTVLCAVKF